MKWVLVYFLTFTNGLPASTGTALYSSWAACMGSADMLWVQWLEAYGEDEIRLAQITCKRVEE